MPHLHGRKLSWRTTLRQDPLGDPIVTVRFLAHLVPNKCPVAALEKDPIALPAPYRVLQTRILIPLDPGRVHPPGKGEDAYSLGLVCNLSFSPKVMFVFSSDIVAITPTGAPARHLIVAPCPSHLPGGGGTRTPPLVPAHGVAPGRVPYLLREDHNRAEGFTGTSLGAMLVWLHVVFKVSKNCLRNPFLFFPQAIIYSGLSECKT